MRFSYRQKNDVKKRKTSWNCDMQKTHNIQDVGSLCNPKGNGKKYILCDTARNL